jgi:hypothetical protein
MEKPKPSHKINFMTDQQKNSRGWQRIMISFMLDNEVNNKIQTVNNSTIIKTKR